MIIHKEQIDDLLPDGTPTKRLLVSYIDKQKEIKFLQYPIPADQMFEWHYTTQKFADPPFQEYDFVKQAYKFNEDGTPVMHQWKSYDNKFVRKVATKELKEMRINEILNSFGSAVDPLFEMNVPDTWWCDIETEVSDEGFPDPEEASTRINTISMTQFPRTIIFSRKNLTEEEKDYIQHSIDNYSEQNNGTDITKGYTFEFRYFPTEKEMLEDFVDFITPIPAISGWNFLAFDWLYIYNRCKQNNIDIEKISPTRKFTTFKITPRSGGKTINVKVPMHKIVYDYLLVYKSWDQIINPKENNTLDFVANKALGIKKVNHEWGFKEFYENHFAEYVFYNCIDTILVEHIDRTLKTAEIWYMLSCVLRIELNVAFSTIQPTHVVMCNFEYPHYKVFPDAKREIGEQADFEGAFVWPTRPGLFKYIGGLDLCWGRYDTHDHPIIEYEREDKNYSFPGIDYSNARINDFDKKFLFDKWYDSIRTTKEYDLFIIADGSLTNFLTREGDFLFDTWFNGYCRGFNDGIAAICSNDRREFILTNRKGKILTTHPIPGSFEKLISNFVISELSSKDVRLFTLDGKFICNLEGYDNYETCNSVYDIGDGYLFVSPNKRDAICIRDDGSQLQTRMNASIFRKVANSLIAIDSDSRIEIYSLDGKLVVDNVLVDTKDGWYGVNGKAKQIIVKNMDGKFNIFDCTNLDFIFNKWFDECLNCDDLAYGILQNNRWIVIDNTGKLITNKSFDNIKSYSFPLKVEKNNLVTLLYLDGELLGTWFDDIQKYYNSYDEFIGTVNGKKYIIDVHERTIRLWSQEYEDYKRKEYNQLRWEKNRDY